MGHAAAAAAHPAHAILSRMTRQWRREPPARGHAIVKQTLYKYMPVQSEESLVRLLEILQGRIYYSSPAGFNDPFEMSAMFNAPDQDEVMALLDGAGPVADLLLSKSARKKIFRQVKATLGANSVVSWDWIESLGVLCLTTTPDDLLMWAHYARNHTGVCLGFDSGFEPFSTAQPVRYQEDRAGVTPLSTSSKEQKLVEKVLFVKSLHWQYEAEWRSVKRPVRDDEKAYYRDLFTQQPNKGDEIAQLLSSEGGPGHYEFDVRALRRIYLGARMQPEWKERVAAAIDAHAPFVKIHEMSLDSRYFRLNAQKVRDRSLRRPRAGAASGRTG
jgi:hypothetical protein